MLLYYYCVTDVYLRMLVTQQNLVIIARLLEVDVFDSRTHYGLFNMKFIHAFTYSSVLPFIDNTCSDCDNRGSVDLICDKSSGQCICKVSNVC